MEKHLSFAGARWQMNTTIYQNRRRHIKLDKFVFETLGLLDLLCKHWIASSVWNFCCWVADVPPRETSPAVKSEEKRMFSQATPARAPLILHINFAWYQKFLLHTSTRSSGFSGSRLVISTASWEFSIALKRQLVARSLNIDCTSPCSNMSSSLWQAPTFAFSTKRCRVNKTNVAKLYLTVNQRPLPFKIK